MARIVRNQRLDSRSARALLPMRHAPYWHALTRGRALGYRKGSKGGTWIAKYRTADGKREQLLLGAADDAFNGETSDVLRFDIERDDIKADPPTSAMRSPSGMQKT
ncbi:hypothetical protein [Sphingomonas sp.]|uniref:hypothetical protein n=1 Tax=Sphingomonas sp. TaxID=28214 RepID=UPI0031E3E5C0